MKYSKLFLSSILLLSLVSCDLTKPQIVSQVTDKDEKQEILEKIKEAKNIHRNRKNVTVDYNDSIDKFNENNLLYSTDKDIYYFTTYDEKTNSSSFKIKKKVNEALKSSSFIPTTENYHLFNIKEKDSNGSYGIYRAEVSLDKSGNETYHDGVIYNSIKDATNYNKALNKEKNQIEEIWNNVEKVSDVYDYASLALKDKTEQDKNHYSSTIRFNELSDKGVGIYLTLDFEKGYELNGLSEVRIDSTYYEDYTLHETRYTLDYSNGESEGYFLSVFPEDYEEIEIGNEYYRAFHDDYIYDRQAQIALLENIDNAFSVVTDRSYHYSALNKMTSSGQNGSINDKTSMSGSCGLADSNGNKGIEFKEEIDFKLVGLDGNEINNKSTTCMYHTKKNNSNTYSIYKIKTSGDEIEKESYNSVTDPNNYQDKKELLFDRISQVWGVIEEVACISSLAMMAMDEIKENGASSNAKVTFEFYKQEEYIIDIDIEFKDNPEYKSLKIENHYDSTYRFKQGSVTTIDLEGIEITKTANLSFYDEGYDKDGSLPYEYKSLFDDIN